MVSVVMPVYNCEKYIEESIQSVLVQSVPFELLIVDDQSTDGTRQVVEKILEYKRVTYIYNENNLVVTGSSNIGESMAKEK